MAQQGSHILSTLLSSTKFTNVYAYSRRKLSESPKLQTIESSESETWPSLFPASAKAQVFISALGTTKAQAGSIEAQRKIDFDLNLALAKAAKEAGVATYVLISGAMGDSSSRFAFVKIKGELEDAVKALGFTHTIIVQPGLIVGDREDSRPAEFAVRTFANILGRVSGGVLKNFWAQDADMIAKAAVSAAIKVQQGGQEPGVWVIGGADIMKLGKTEWES
jgi:uncharacterized protein YbjT (DUF2867 family)